MKFYHTDCDCGNTSCIARLLVCADETKVKHGKVPMLDEYEVIGKVFLPAPVVDGITSMLNISRDPDKFIGMLETLRHIEAAHAPSSLN